MGALGAPAFASRLGGPGVLGLLYAAPSMGAVVASATSGWAARVRRHGRAIVYAAAAWGIFIALAGVARTAWLAVALVALAGPADMVSGLFRSTIWNTTVPDNLRGRLAGIEMISYTSGQATNFRNVWIRIGMPPSSLNCLEGALFLVFAADVGPMRVPNPAAGTITKTFIEGVQYKSVPSNFQMADP